MSEATTTPTTPPSSSSSLPPVSTAKKYEGDGHPFKGKLIGMEDLSIDRDEKICLDSMFKLKAVVKARGEHKQRIQLSLTMTAVKVIDDTTKAQIASHEIERISFVVIDPRDTRAFGYVYNTADDRHQFWAIKTEKVAAVAVLSLKELFELAFEQYSNTEKEKAEGNKTTSPPLPSLAVTTPPPVVTTPPPVIATSPPEPQPTVPVQEQPPATSVVLQPPPPPAAVLEPVPEFQVKSLLDDEDWGYAPSTTNAQTSQQNSLSLFSFDELIAPVVQQPPPTKTDDPLFDLFAPTTTTTTTHQPASSTNAIFDVFANLAPPPVQQSNSYGNMIPQQRQPNYVNTTTVVPQQQTSFPYQQQNLFAATSMSPVAPPSVTSPFAGLDILGSTSTTTNKAAKDLFFPTALPLKTIQQMQMDTKLNAFYRP